MRILAFALVAGRLLAQSPVMTPFQEAKARTLLREQLPCLGCHAFEGEGGRIAPPLDDVGARRDAAYIRAMIEDPSRVAPAAAMPRAPMPDATRELVIRYLSRAARAAGSPPASVIGQRVEAVRDPARLYATWCASCHGARGGGDGPNAGFLPVRPAVHRDSAAMSARADDVLFDVIAAGGSPMGKSARMPALGQTLTSAEMRSLVAYIRQLCACAGPAWSRDGIP